MKTLSTQQRTIPSSPSLSYTLTRKMVKNTNLRIKRDGSVLVSAHPFVPIQQIDSFVLSKKDFIEKNKKRFLEKQKAMPSNKQYINGESFYILGNHLRLKVFESSTNYVENDGTFLKLYVKDVSSFSTKQKVINTFFDAEVKKQFSQIMEETHKIFSKYGVLYPEMKMRNMKSRWGSCATKKGIITLNKKLIEAPRPCIEYVVLHEFVHFLHPNHSKKFYACVATHMPDWKERKRLLESLPILL